MTKFIQFELWKDCSQGCRFCCNKGQKQIDKLNSCLYVLSILDSLKVGQYDYIGLIGGEFFNGELIEYENYFNKILTKISKLKPQKLFIATSLLYDLNNIIPTIEKINELCINKLVICTSWDAKYRFRENQEQLWHTNMLKLKQLFTNVDLHIEIILMQPFIDLVNNGQFSIKQMEAKYNARIDFIEPSSGLFYTDKYACQDDIPGFFPTRYSFIEFLNNIKNDVDLHSMLSMNLRSDELYYIENGQHKVAKNRHNTDGRCEISDKTKKYDIGFIDSNEPMRNTILNFIELGGY